MSEYIGAKISLVSKSNIRYVGTLHEINGENSTVALTNVLSFGTEGRAEDPSKEIAPSTQVFPHIVFRGSDVKDLRIEEQAKPQPKQDLPDDPAILNATPPTYAPPPQPPQQQQQGPGPQQPQFQQQQAFYGQQQFPAQGRYPYPGPYGPGPYQQGPVGYGPPPQQQFNQYGQGPAGPIGQNRGPQGQGPVGPGMMPPHQQPIGPGMGGQMLPQGPGPQHVPQQQQQQQQQAQPINRGPTSSTPVPVGSQAATPKPVGQTETAPIAKPADNKPAPPPTGPSNKNVPSKPQQQRPAPPPFALAPTQVTAASKQQQAALNAPSGPKGTRNQVAPALPLSSPARNANVAPVQAAAPVSSSPQAVKEKAKEAAKPTEAQLKSHVEELVQKVSLLKAGGSASTKSPPTQPQAQNENRRSGDQHQGTHENRRSGDHRPPRGRGGHRGGNFAQPRKVEVPNTDYDFEEANAKFNKEDLVKEVIATADPSILPTNGAEEGAQVAVAEPAAANGDAGAVKVEGITDGFYNSGKSFFDNISCESKERAEGNDGGRRGWRGEEQKKNLETFGQGSVDSYGGPRFYRGGWRGGRGRGYRRGGNSFGRGGGGGSFRGGAQQPQQ